MLIENGVLVGLAFGLAQLLFALGVLMQTLPVPRQEWKIWGPTMMWDACMVELALGTLSAVQLGAKALSDLIGSAYSAPIQHPGIVFGLIMAQLVAIDTAALLLISAVSATVVLAPVADLLSRMLGSGVSWVTSAIVIWSIIALILKLLPDLWLTLYTVGICFYALPFRIGRRIATGLMASSIVLAVGLPLMPSLALWLEGYIGFQGAINPIEKAVAEVQANPLAIIHLIYSLPAAFGNLIGSVIIALVVFPTVYIALLSVISGSLARAIGGSGASSFFMFKR
jgi:hypothetical protein